MLEPERAAVVALAPFGGPSEQQLPAADSSTSSSSWLFPSQSVYSTQTATPRIQHQLDQRDHPRLTRNGFALVDASSPPVAFSPQSNDQPIDVSRLTGVPFKQMTTVGRYGQGSRRAYGLMTNIGAGSATAMRAPGTPVLGQGNTAQSATVSQQPKNPKLYKTELCRSWMDHGRCNYGERCQYAHGEHEKRPIPRHPKYKTAYCQSYHQSGYCPYGPRCHFIHSEEPAALARNTSSTISNTFVVPSSNNGLLLTMGSSGNATVGGTLHAHACGSAGESPVPSSAGSGSDSPLGSSSPGLDLDDNASSLSSAHSWNNAFTDNSFNFKRSHFEWPSATAAVFGSVDPLTAPAKTPLHSCSSLCNPSTFDQSSLLINDLLAWNFEDKPVSKSSSELTVSPVRLPVFAQFSNPSSSS